MKKFGFTPTDILIPNNCDMKKWSCVACDQYTSEPEYWLQVEKEVGTAPSTLSLMLPEIYLSETESRTKAINENMNTVPSTNMFNNDLSQKVIIELDKVDGVDNVDAVVSNNCALISCSVS